MSTSPTHTTTPSLRRRPAGAAHLWLSLGAMLAMAACGGDGVTGGGTNNGGGQQVQVGQNLDGQPANSTVRCIDGAPAQTPQYQGFFVQPNAFLPFLNANSCTMITFFDGAQVPAPGVVVAANIKVGPVTGPMRFVRARVLFKRGIGSDTTACCSVEQVGQTFTPAPNSITTVPLNFAMTHDPIPAQNNFTAIAAQDLVAIEVLAPNVPIPGTWVNNFSGNFSQANYIYWPAFTLNPNNAGQNKKSNTGFSGFMPSYNLNFVAAR
jgi:hypothetical protein